MEHSEKFCRTTVPYLKSPHFSQLLMAPPIAHDRETVRLVMDWPMVSATATVCAVGRGSTNRELSQAIIPPL
jgi:hypothetical protein